MNTRLCHGENVRVYAVCDYTDEDDPSVLALEIQHLIESLEDYSWINVDWIVGPDGEYSALVYVHA